MKKVYLLAAAILFSIVNVGAQNLERKTGNKKIQKPLNVNRITPNAVSTNSVPIWTDDFSNPSNWVISHAPNASTDDWVIGTNPPSGQYKIDTINSTTRSNGFALFDSDALCSGDQIANLTTANPIDLSAYSNVRLSFQQYYRRYHDSTYVYISSDGNTWTKFEVNGNLVGNDYSGDDVFENPHHVTIDISSAAGGQDSVYIRFQFYSPDTNLTATDPAAGCAYSWAIDDVVLNEIFADDGMIMQSYGGEYTVLPILQADQFRLRGRFINHGLNPITGAVIQFQVTDPMNNLYYDSTAASGTVNPGDTSAWLTSLNSYVPAMIGSYLVDQTLEVPNDLDFTNDVSTGMLDVNDSLYGRDNTWFDVSDFRGALGFQGAPVSFAEKFHISQMSQFTSVSIYLGAPTLGDEINLTVHTSASGVPAAVLGSTANYTITANDTSGGFITIPFQAPVTVNPGEYFVAINQLDTNFVSIGVAKNIYTPNANYFNIDNAGWNPFEAANIHRALMIMVNNPSWTINSVSEPLEKSVFNVYPNPTDGMIIVAGNGNAEKDVIIRILNSLGQEVKSATFDSFNYGRFDLSELPAGTYTVNVKSNNGEENKIIVLQ